MQTLKTLFAAQNNHPPSTLKSKAMSTKLYQRIASLVTARLNCEATNNKNWLELHEDRLSALVKEHMPSGSGFDSGTEIKLDECTGDKLIFFTAFHHINEMGGYDGWTNHTVKISPSFHGFNMRITGRDRNDIKEYIGDTFHHALNMEIA